MQASLATTASANALHPGFGLPRIEVIPAAVEPLIPLTQEGELPSSRDLLLQSLLHLPRLATLDGTVGVDEAVPEIERLRALRAAELAPLHMLASPPDVVPGLHDLRIGVADAAAAESIIGTFHYLRSFRADSVTIGAYHNERVAALCSISPLDLPHIADHLPAVRLSEVAVVSRVFAFDWAPRNTVSYLLARIEKAGIAPERGVRLFLTYLNPNLGFSGASYRAANWVPLGREAGTRYAYLDAQYITDRQVARLSATDRARVQYSQMPLRPLLLFCRWLDKRDVRRRPKRLDLVFERPDG
jgi:hypothetical protein